MASAPVKADHLNLKRRSRTPAWAALLWRATLAMGLIAVVLAAHWLDRDGLKDAADGRISFTDVLYFTMITVTTVGYGDIVPVSTEARLLDTFVVTPIRLFLFLIFFGTAYEFLLRQVWERWRMRTIQRGLRDHTIVAGYGASGAEAVSELLRRGARAEQIVVVDQRQDALQAASACGVNVLEADATRNEALQAVQIAQAGAVIIAAGRDDTSILMVLTARRLAPEVPISVVIGQEDNEALARQAGADTVINPSSFAGLLLAGSTHGRHIADYLSDLASSGGRVFLGERQVQPSEVGAPLSGLGTGIGVRLYRGEACFCPEDPEAGRLQVGDVVVEIVSRPAGSR